MTALTSDDLARGWARGLEEKEARRRGMSVVKERPFLARKLGVATGTLENLSRDRIKRLPHALFEALRCAVLQELSREIKAHEHELTVLVANGAGDSDPTVQEVVAGLQRLRALMPEAGK